MAKKKATYVPVQHVEGFAEVPTEPVSPLAEAPDELPQPAIEKYGRAVPVHALTDPEVIEKCKALGFTVIPNRLMAKLYVRIMQGNATDLANHGAALSLLGRTLGATTPKEAVALWHKYRDIDKASR